MEFISRVSAHTGRNRELCLSAHGRLPGTLWYMHTFLVEKKSWLSLLYIESLSRSEEGHTGPLVIGGVVHDTTWYANLMTHCVSMLLVVVLI